MNQVESNRHVGILIRDFKSSTPLILYPVLPEILASSRNETIRREIVVYLGLGTFGLYISLAEGEEGGATGQKSYLLTHRRSHIRHD